MKFEFWQKKITQVFFWLSPVAIVLLLLANFPTAEKLIWELPVVAPILVLLFAAWMMSMVCVVMLTVFGSRFRDQVLHDYVLQKDRDEREEIISGEAAKKAIVITMVVCAVALIFSTGRLNVFDDIARSSLTVGHFQLTDSAVKEITDGELNGIQYELPMSKTALFLLIMLIQLTSYHGIKAFSLRKGS
ncbi:MAG: hypothetical protein KF802_15690 [Bdellovibrionaceae bacterium]|nr:hypothetical protein [Pseudobdellovibrionaceae bacterium]